MALQVPTDVWQRACDLFKTREWVTSCGSACKFFRWMLHHWKDAHAIDLTLHLRFEDLPGKISPVLESIGSRDQGAGAEFFMPGALRVFRGLYISDVILHRAMMVKARQRCQGFDESWPRYTCSEGPLERLCARLLPLMDRLTALNLFIPKAPHLPPFNELEHLELHYIEFDGVGQSLTGLHTLKTLFLSCEFFEALLPEARLKELSKLRHLPLDDLFPAQLSLPRGCRLDIKGEAIVMDEVIGVAWQDALKHLHACTCRWTRTRRKFQISRLSVQSLPSFLSMAAGCVKELSLFVTQPFCCRMLNNSIRLEPAVCCNLERLCLKINLGTQFTMYIPAAVHPGSLEIYADILGLYFEDAMTSCAILTNVNVFFRATSGSSVADLLSLIHAPFARNGVYVRLVTEQNKFKLVTSMPPSPEGGTHDVAKHLDILEGAPCKCSCTICWECMRH